MKLRIAVPTSGAYFTSKPTRPKICKPVVLTEQKTEMRAASSGRAMTQDAIADFVGNPSLPVIEEFQVITKLSQQLLEDLRRGCEERPVWT